ncbi:GNAT family N-acetyltransferase [Rhizobacter sp. Root404]|uniref:GNAT family N-acetyltransferase n=1 Tax=Rhizobacter sp. Root404 TaxID=1736528 RepID=UPI0006F798C4|nr:GNAT family N-acetyltransferase [Rhizobacter sp. Root404]KQW38239.1 hypothetical protein ASC76_09385 [Rhizobacter sp. Root404]
MTYTILVPYGPEHDAATVRWLASDELRDTFGFRGDINIESHRRWVNSTHHTHIWAVVNEAGVHCGNTLLHVNPRHCSGYFQIYIGEPTARGHGLGKAALRRTLANAFATLSLHRVWLHTFADNRAAESLYRQHGFTHEGIERDAICVNGKFVSQNRWSLLLDEWLRLLHEERAA